MAELKVVQVAGLDQLADVNMSLDSILVKSVLQDLVVVYELVLVLGAPLDSREGERVRVEGVKHGAVDSTSGALLNLSQLQLKVRVHPVEDVSLAHEVGLVHHSN